MFFVCHLFDIFVVSRGQYYSETTWAVGIAQLTRHEVQGGAKNPETEGRGSFAPTADRVGKFISPRNNLFHTQRRFFSGKVQIPKWAPFAPNGTANQIAEKSWNHRGHYWTLNPMDRKPWKSDPSVGQHPSRTKESLRQGVVGRLHTIYHFLELRGDDKRNLDRGHPTGTLESAKW